MSRAWGDMSDDSTESENLSRGRVSATAFTHAIASELRLKSDSRKLLHLEHRHTHKRTTVCKVHLLVLWHTQRDYARSQHGDKDGIEASADILAIVTSGGVRTMVPHSNLIEQARSWQGSDTSYFPYQPTSVSQRTLPRDGSSTHRSYGSTQSQDPNRDLSSDRGG